ncbi:MAG: hypothetical protein HPY94_01710 [Clostridia bacterium]|nr:hypothetical protein [Clostridia bacterium]
MKKGQIYLYIFVVLILTVGVFIGSVFASGAKNCFSAPDKAEDMKFDCYSQSGSYVYVGGAVQKSGWLFVEYGATYGDLLDRAGKLEMTVAPSYVSSYSLPIGKRRTVIFDYTESGAVCPSINVNSSFFAVAATGKISPDIVEVIENYKKSAYFTDMTELEALLGEELYLNVFYKLHVGENL